MVGGRGTSDQADARLWAYHAPTEPGHKIFPCLLRGVEITRPNQAWAMDIRYIPMVRGFIYLAVVFDWFSRCALAWQAYFGHDTTLPIRLAA
jgi:transposase InsO family protein